MHRTCSRSATCSADPPEAGGEAHVVEFGTTRVVTAGFSAATSGTSPPDGARTDREITLALAGTGGCGVAGDRAPGRCASWDQVLITLSPPHGSTRPAGGAAHVLQIDLDELAVPSETVRVAATRLRASPLYALVRDHVADVIVEPPALPHAAAAALGATTVNLVRALVLSAAEDPRALGDARHASTTARIQAYVAAHLRDPDLGPARIAAANAVSTRLLYKIYEALGTSPERSILHQRLQGARADLASPGRRHQSIAAIARSWGFRNPSSFAQQFRRAFGVTPRQCRAGQTDRSRT